MTKQFEYLKHKNSFFLKIFISYITIFSVLLLILSISSYTWMTNLVAKQAEQTYTSSLEEVRDTLDRKFDSLKSFSIQLSVVPWVQKIMYMNSTTINSERINAVELGSYVKELSLYSITNDFIDDIAICFNDKDTVISNRGKDNIDSFFKYIFNFKNISSDQWKEKLLQKNLFTILPPNQLKVYDRPQKMLVYLQSLPLSETDFKCTLLLFINENRLITNLKNNIISKNGSLYIIDSNNSSITGYNMSTELDNIIYTNSYTELLINKDNKLKFSNNKKYVFFQTQSKITGWKYVAAVPMESISGRIMNIRIIIILISLLYLITAFFLSYGLSTLYYKPIANIVGIIRAKFLQTEEIQYNEFNLIDKAINSMLTYKDKTEKEMQLYFPLVKNACLKKLLEDKDRLNGRDELLTVLNLLDITFSNNFFTCILILLNEDNVVDDAVQNIFSTKLSSCNIFTYFTELDGRNKALILNAGYDHQTNELISLIKDCLKEAVLEYNAIGIGKTYKDINNLNKSYIEARTAIEYRFISGQGSIISFCEVEGNGEYIYYFPIDEEGKIINNIKSGDYTQAIELMREIIRVNINRRQLSPDIMIYLYFNLIATAMKVLEEMNIKSNISVHLDDLWAIDTMAEMNKYIEDIYKSICCRITSEKESSNIKLRRDIIEYIDTHYDDKNISLNLIGDVFSMSPSYLSRFIKDQIGMNFIDYLNSKRIDASKEFLKSDKTILQIANQVGFSNDITYRRLFKKYTGVTPGKYREDNPLSC